MLTNNAKAAKTRSAAVGMETSSPVISVDLIAAGYGGTGPKALRLTPEFFTTITERVSLRLVQVPDGAVDDRFGCVGELADDLGEPCWLVYGMSV